MNGEQQREHFRIVYPVGQHAKLVIGRTDYNIIDISQRGVHFRIKGSTTDDWPVGMKIKGSISLLHGASALVSGSILRSVSDNSVVLFLDKPIELKNMYDEHRFVIKKFNQ